MLFKMQIRLITSMAVTTVIAICCLSAQTQTPVPNRDLAAIPLENIQLNAQSIGALFSDLAISYDIPIGLEIGSEKDRSVPYTIELKKGTLTDLLNQFIAQHTQYDWEIRDGVVSIFPKDNYRDTLFKSLLKAKIKRFSVKENTSCWALAESLMSTPEIKKILEADGTSYRSADFTGAYIPQLGRHFTLEASDLTLRSILDRVIKQSSTARFWVIARNDDRSLNISLSAMHEDFPKPAGHLKIYRE